LAWFRPDPDDLLSGIGWVGSSFLRINTQAYPIHTKRAAPFGAALDLDALFTIVYFSRYLPFPLNYFGSSHKILMKRAKATKN